MDNTHKSEDLGQLPSYDTVWFPVLKHIPPQLYCCYYYEANSIDFFGLYLVSILHKLNSDLQLKGMKEWINACV